jgi:acyl-homoserine-lactone acylase
MVIGNPHFPWNGPNRIWQLHVTGPEGYDVMGVGIAGTPIPTLGFNQDVAWTHTVTAARHFTLHALTLEPADPTPYMLDGQSVAMTPVTVSVPMPEGRSAVTRTLYTARFGPLVVARSRGSPGAPRPPMWSRMPTAPTSARSIPVCGSARRGPSPRSGRR